MLIKVLWNGREVDPKEVPDIVQRAIYEEAAQLAQDRVGRIRCPKHNTSATLVLKKASAQKLDFDARGCCDELADAIHAALK